MKKSVGRCAMSCKKLKLWRDGDYEEMCAENEPDFFGPSFLDYKL